MKNFTSTNKASRSMNNILSMVRVCQKQYANYSLEDLCQNPSKLAIANMRLILSVIGDYSCDGLAPEDLFQEGYCGLQLAAEHFDVSRGCSFSTFAFNYIRTAIRNAAKKYGKVLNRPNVFSAEAKKLRKAENECILLDIVPTIDELAARSGLDEDRIIELQSQLEIISGDEPIDMDEETGESRSRFDLMGQEDYYSFEECDLQKSKRVHIENSMDCLTKQEEKAIRLYYGLTADGEAHNKLSISNDMERSETRVGQLIASGECKLRKVLKKSDLDRVA